MTAIGYEVADIGLMAPETVPLPPNFSAANVIGLYVLERPLRGRTEQFAMSQGMFRALATLIHLNFGIYSKRPRCVMIDDIGEGLDFDRSSGLISLIVSKCQDANLQVILTTNDRFVMNAVPIDYWTVLDRRGNTVMCLTKAIQAISSRVSSLRALATSIFSQQTMSQRQNTIPRKIAFFAEGQTEQISSKDFSRKPQAAEK